MHRKTRAQGWSVNLRAAQGLCRGGSRLWTWPWLLHWQLRAIFTALPLLCWPMTAAVDHKGNAKAGNSNVQTSNSQASTITAEPELVCVAAGASVLSREQLQRLFRKPMVCQNALPALACFFVFQDKSQGLM